MSFGKREGEGKGNGGREGDKREKSGGAVAVDQDYMAGVEGREVQAGDSGGSIAGKDTLV